MEHLRMKCAVWTGGGEVEIQEKPMPDVSDDEVLVSVSYTGICGSDMHIIDDGLPAETISPPRVLGHEFSGIVESVGLRVTHFKKGDRVVAHPTCPCGKCFFCHVGAENLCSSKFSIITGPKGGSFAEYVVVKEQQTYHLPETIPLKRAALVEPTAIAVHCVDRAGIRSGETVLVIGGGPIGLLCLQVARLAGASTVVLSEPQKKRREAAECMGASIVVDPLHQDLSEVIQEATEGLGVDVAIEAAGAPKTIQQAVQLIRDGGRLVLVGWPPLSSAVPIHPYQIYRRELDIKGSFFSPFSFQRAIRLLPRLDLDLFLTHCFELRDIGRALDAQRKQEGLKVLLCPHPAEEGRP